VAPLKLHEEKSAYLTAVPLERYHFTRIRNVRDQW